MPIFGAPGLQRLVASGVKQHHPNNQGNVRTNQRSPASHVFFDCVFVV
jgi:hypothetical protein